MLFAQLTYRESLRDIEACLAAAPEKSYHMGFTGTYLWLDLTSRVYIVLLTSQLHPEGKRKVGPLRRRVTRIICEGFVVPGWPN